MPEKYKLKPQWAITAAAAALLQSCLTVWPHRWQPTRLPRPWDSPGKTLEWVAISFSNAWKWKVKGKSLSRVWLFATPWTAAHQAPPSIGLSRQEYWSGVHPVAFKYSFCLGKNLREADILFQGRFAESVRKVNCGHWLFCSSGLSDETIFVLPCLCFHRDGMHGTLYQIMVWDVKKKGIEKSHQKRLPAL